MPPKHAHLFYVNWEHYGQRISQNANYCSLSASDSHQKLHKPIGVCSLKERQDKRTENDLALFRMRIFFVVVINGKWCLLGEGTMSSDKGPGGPFCPGLVQFPEDTEVSITALLFFPGHLRSLHKRMRSAPWIKIRVDLSPLVRWCKKKKKRSRPLASSICETVSF